MDVVSTDHAPHTVEEKEADSVWDVKPGMPGLETMLPLLLTQVNEGRLSLSAYVKLASENPARLFYLYPQKGTIKIGTDADFTIVDMAKESVLSSEKLHSKSKVTPFDGWKVKGVPIYSIVRGNVVMKDGEITGTPQGKHLKASV